MFRRAVVILCVATIAAAVLASGYWLWSGNQPLNSGAERFVIEAGDGATTIARNLAEESIIAEPYTFVLWSYQRGYTGSLKAGEYRIDPNMTLLGLLEKFSRGEVITYSITFIEGWTFRQFLDQLGKHAKVEQTMGNRTDGEIMSSLGHQNLHPEGRFFPDTYIITTGVTDIEILRQAFDRMQKVLTREWHNRDPEQKLSSPDEALTLASIIEKETGKPEEQGIISGVFHNRLQRKMRMQTDPTVIYGLGDQFNGNLTRAHLRQDTPYNTYTRSGLPPTPIANPGEGAIRAALHPAATAALYFVSRGDGSHKFSETLAEHNKAVGQYQLGRKKKAKSSSSAND